MSSQQAQAEARTVAEPMVLTGLSMFTRSMVQTTVHRDLIDETRSASRTLRTQDGAVPVYKPAPNLDRPIAL